MTSSDDVRPPVDLDLIADYVDGLLPAAESEAVARRIDGDAEWARAAEQVRAARTAIAARLRSVGETTERMPDDVFTRILAALPHPAIASLANEAEAAPPNGAAETATAANRGVHDADANRGGSATDETGDAADTRPPARVIAFDRARRRDRRRIWGNVAKIAAALVVLAGIGTGVRALTEGTTHSSESSSAKTSNGAAAPQSAAGSGALGLSIQASGHDYRNDLGAGPVATSPPAAAFGGRTPPPPGTDTAQPAPRALGSTASVPRALSRLAHDGLPACAAAVSSEFGAQPIAADFAFYRGQPAVVFRLSTNREVAVGASCGLPGQGSDVLASAG